MKKGLLILFCFVYFCSSVGVALNLHYCGGKLKSVSLIHSDEAKCCGKKKMKSKNCCKEKSIVYKVKDNQDSHGKYFSFKSAANVLAIYNNSAISCLKNPNLNLFFLPYFHAPPEYDDGPTYLVNGVFRI